MSKGKGKPFQPIVTPAENHTFTTSAGKVIQLQAVSRFLIDKRSGSKKKIEPPTYEVETLGGGKERHYHDETTVQTEEEKKAWADYVEAKNAEDQRFNRDFFKMLILYGTTLELPEDDLWERKQRAVGITIPDDPVEKYLHFLESEYLVIEEDATDLMAKILEVSGSSKEEADSIRQSFRAAVQRARTEQSVGLQTRLDSQPKVRRARSSPRLGPKT